MSYSLSIPANIGTSGLTLKASFVDTAGDLHASLKNLACTELGSTGLYRFATDSVPDAYRGQVVYHVGTATTSAFADGGVTTYAIVSINPQECENSDVKTSTRAETVSAGAGAFAITVTVTDGTDLLQNATVRVTEGVTTAVATTDASGNATFSLDAATYTVTVTKAGYTFTPTTRTVTGAQAGTLTNDLEMTQTAAISAPVDPSLCRVYGYLTNTLGEAAVGVEVSFLLTPATPMKDGTIVSGRTANAVTDANGFFQIDLQRNDTITPAASVWKVTCAAVGLSAQSITLNAATYNLATVIT